MTSCRARVGNAILLAVMNCLLIFGVVIIIWEHIQTLSKLNGKTANAQGIIVSCKYEEYSISYGRTTHCLPTVRFTTTSGEKIEFVSSYSVGSLLFYKGKEVTVSYNPRNPHDALITSWELWAEDCFLLIVLLFVGSLGGWTYIRACKNGMV
jgi:hypothetical protein